MKMEEGAFRIKGRRTECSYRQWSYAPFSKNGTRCAERRSAIGSRMPNSHHVGMPLGSLKRPIVGVSVGGSRMEEDALVPCRMLNIRLRSCSSWLHKYSYTTPIQGSTLGTNMKEIIFPASMVGESWMEEDALAP